MRSLYGSTREYPTTQTDSQNGNDVVPMGVSAVLYGMGNKDNGKKGRDKKGKTKEAKNGKGKVPTEQFDGECGYCGKWGHRRADCRKKIYDDKGKGKGASAASAAAEGPSVGAVTYEDWNMEPKPDSWAFAVQVEFVACSAGTPGERLLILGDSGSDEHLCPVDFADHVAVEPLAFPLSIRDVSGKILSVYGTRRVRVLLDGVVDCVIPFVVADVTRPIVSLGKLTKQDFSVHLERQASRIEHGGIKASRIAGHNTFYFDVLIPADGARACAGVTDAPAAAVPHVPAVEVEESSEY